MAGRVSVVIPTFNRKEVLVKAIRGHLAQSAVNEIEEILVVDDGSTDGTDSAVSALAADAPFPLRRLYQPNRGQAAARNLGISEATAEIILFTDDDIIPAPDLLAEHLRWHDQHPEREAAVMGYVEWSPEVRPTPFMKWFGLDGPLFAYEWIRGKVEVDGFQFFYTCNVSLKAELLRQTGNFDEDFAGYGWEDAELGYRLRKNGMRLFYNPGALAYHYKHVTFAEACRRAEKVALAWRIFEQKEAGQCLLAYEAQRQAAEVPRSLLKRALGLVPESIKSGILSPLKLLLDTQIPLPWRLYRRFYFEASAKLSQGQPT
jgi:GT2 family glycosyltransferase